MIDQIASLPPSFWMLATVATVLIGYRLMRAIDPRQFNLVTAWLLLVTGLKLIWDGLM